MNLDIAPPPPGHPLCERAKLLLKEGKREEAVETLKHLCRDRPDLVEAWYLLGVAQGQGGELEEGLRALQKALRLDPRHVPSLCDLGNILSLKGEYELALTYLHSAIRLAPDNAAAHANLGRVYLLMQRRKEAEEASRRALSLDPDLFPAYHNLIQILSLGGNFDEALALCRRGYAIYPRQQKALQLQEASLLEQMGALEAAYERLAPFLEAPVLPHEVAAHYARVARALNREQEAIALIEERLSKEEDTDILAGLCFALGDLYDRAGKYETAFSYYRKGNALRAGEKPYHPEEWEEQVTGITRIFTPKRFKRLPRASMRDNRPIFIVGMPRSGTTLTEQILAAHPQVAPGGELVEMTHINEELSRRLGYPFPEYAQLLDQGLIDAMAQRYLDHLTAIAPESPRVTDKMPHNFVYLGLIALLFPKAKIVHCLRDPLDTCLSCYFQDFNFSHEYAFDLAHLGHHYRHYRRLMQHWRKVLPMPILELRYEDLVSKPEPTVRRLLAGLRLPWDPRCLSFHEVKRPVTTASYDQVRRPLYKSSMKRWQRYAPYLAPLKRALKG